MSQLGSFSQIYAQYQDARTVWEQYRPIWCEISKYVGIKVDNNYAYNSSTSPNNSALDILIDDPTAAIAVNQAGDYMLGAIWGAGDGIFELAPSQEVLDKTDPIQLEGFYKFATQRSLYHMNHPDAGFMTAFQPYMYDQMAYGTSGVGVFKNKAFEAGIEGNALIFRNYGVDNTMIDEGKAGIPEIVFALHNWKVTRIVTEFAYAEGEFNAKQYARLPEIIRKDWENKNYNHVHEIVHGVVPRHDYNPKFAGKRGTKYRGVWFLDNKAENHFFLEEDYHDRPIVMARSIKLRGEVYGRAYATIGLSAIRALNFMTGSAIDTVDKMNSPPMGIFSNALLGDSVFDSSANSLTVLNPTHTTGSNNNPTFQMHDIGDPSGIINFLMPMMRDQINAAAKVDQLLDSVPDVEITATQSLQRFNIRAKAVTAMMAQQKNESFVPITKRAINSLYSMGELGINPETQKDISENLLNIGQSQRVIPQAVLDAVSEGKPWFELRFNNEMEKIARVDDVENLIQMIQVITALAAINPQAVLALNLYNAIEVANTALGSNNELIVTEKEFQAQIEQAAQQQAQQNALQAQESSARSNKDQAFANQAQADATA